jgi:hypothetical protein
MATCDYDHKNEALSFVSAVCAPARGKRDHKDLFSKVTTGKGDITPGLLSDLCV